MTEPGASPTWDDLFVDLGLPPETSPTAAAPEPPALEAAPEPTAAEHEPTEKEEAPAPRGRRRRSPAVAALPEETPVVAEAMEQPAELAIESLEACVPAEEPALEVGAGELSAVEGGEEAPPAKGRSRRRRRGRGSKSASPAETSSAAPGSEAPAEGIEAPAAEATESIPPGTESEEESERRPRRRRLRGRNHEREETPPAIPDANADVSDEAEEELEPVGRDEEVDDLSNWNVPTWAELIGSLYRPER